MSVFATMAYNLQEENEIINKSYVNLLNVIRFAHDWNGCGMAEDILITQIALTG